MGAVPMCRPVFLVLNHPFFRFFCVIFGVPKNAQSMRSVLRSALGPLQSKAIRDWLMLCGWDGFMSVELLE